MEPRTKPFVICEVEFEDRIARSISCSSWIIKLDHLADEKPQTYCLLPKDKGTDSSLLAKYDTIPGKDWTPFKCKILGECSMYLTFNLYYTISIRNLIVDLYFRRV